MDRDEALKLLRGGADGIAKWNCYKRTADDSIDLSHVNLAGVALIEEYEVGEVMYVSGVNFLGVNLDGADLSGAQLIEANLNLTRLSGATLRGTVLMAASFGKTHLYDADLRSAVLTDATFSRAEIHGANLSGAFLGRTTFKEMDLSSVKGLEASVHDGPSTIGIDTLIRSRGKIPEAFLRGCGLPDAWIANLPALIGAMEPIQFHSVFLSYSSKDKSFVERLYADLRSRGVRCWYAPENLKIGEWHRIGIDEAIRVHDKLLLVLTKNSVRSDWVEKEVETAMERERREKRTVLFPVKLDDSVMKVEIGWAADIRRSRNIGDFRRWKDHDSYQKAFERLLRDLKAAEPLDNSEDASHFSIL